MTRTRRRSIRMRLLGLELPPTENRRVRISLDELGHVITVRPNAEASEADPKYQAVFETAIRTAIDTWHFKPAVQRTFRG